MIATGSPLRPPRRVLLVKPSALGDVVTAVPVLRGLRRTFPAARLSWLVSDTCAPLLAGDADLDEVVLFERKRLGRAWHSPAAAGALRRLLQRLHAARFDWVLDLQGLLRSALLAAATEAPLRAGFADAREGARWFYTQPLAVTAAHTVDRNIELARRLGVDARPDDMTLTVSPAGRRFVERIAAEHGLERGAFLACVPATRWQSKQYPARHWRAVVAELAADVPVALLGGPGDRPLCAAIADGLGPGVVNLAGWTGVAELVGAIAASAGVVCCDSAAKFIAPAVGVGAVALIGPTRPERTGPWPRGWAVVADVPCQGCLRRRCGHRTCMELLAPRRVVAAARQMLSGRRAPCLTDISSDA